MLPQEIFVDILTRLPPKFIGRFRCVSKPWRSFLSQSKFIRDHLTRIKQYPVDESLILVTIHSNSLYSVSLSNAHHLLHELTLSAFNLNFAVQPDFWTEGIPSCDGLLLICGSNDQRLLINPVTREVRELPISPYAIDPRASFTMYGLGYDSVNDDYKVVALSYYNSDNEYEPDCTEMFVNVYSVRHGAWKRVESSPYDHAVGHVTSGVFVSGCIHWLASRTTDYASVIVGFDLVEEKFCEVSPPSSVDGARFVFDRLVDLGGRLCLCPSTRSVKTDMWLMMDYGVQDSWRKFTITDAEEAEFRPVCLSGKEEVVMVKDEETVSENLVLYNLEKETFKDIKVQDIIEEFHVGGTYIQTLVSPYYNNQGSGGD